MIWGKVIGALAGFAFMKWPGAILGALVGHWFDRGMAQDFSKRGAWGRFLYGAEKAAGDANFIYTLFAVMGHVAKAKGRVTERDIAQAQYLMQQLKLDTDATKEAQDAFREGKEATFPLQQVMKDFSASFYGNRDVLQLFMEQLIGLALNDGVLDKTEHEVLVDVAKALGFTRFQLDQWLMMEKAAFRFHQQRQRSHAGSGGRQSSTKNDLADAYQILGVTEKNSNAEIKKAYRKLMARHHPDKLASQGLPEEVMKQAQQKARDIQAAYEQVKEHRDIR
ncbi:molecular chaperone DjlA [Idiomarina piscisalsi]|uniref:Co-chaperone protein DjlA n=1 Tax=Idiomarina piscisalsi TaxID=1096243 RepID=A0ABN5AQR7_9GAMM|nr:co-chaperone DjlA [Idiomarina piscisalsi]ASG65012.1 molecular chaperone DjlA [Idiomarina piscisalsi]